ncbi:MAG: hypothetical protein ACI9JM_001893 [Halioglobus sp.]|jgi:hypothetical protein
MLAYRTTSKGVVFSSTIWVDLSEQYCCPETYNLAERLVLNRVVLAPMDTPRLQLCSLASAIPHKPGQALMASEGPGTLY